MVSNSNLLFRKTFITIPNFPDADTSLYQRGLDKYIEPIFDRLIRLIEEYKLENSLK